jgi:hypothetical protein
MTSHLNKRATNDQAVERFTPEVPNRVSKWKAMTALQDILASSTVITA